MAWYNTAGDWLGGHWFDGRLLPKNPIANPSTSYTPPGAPSEATQVTQVSPAAQAAFDPMGNQQIMNAANAFGNNEFNQTYDAAQNMAQYGAGQVQEADSRLMGGYNAPTAIRPTNVTAQTPGANTASTGAAIGRTVDALTQSNQSREGQSQTYNTAMDWAQGNMPSVGRSMADEAGVIAGSQFQRAGSEANQAYGSTAANAARSYQDALAAQNFATTQAGSNASRIATDAGTNAARQVGASASDAVLRQAALVAGARDGNIGLATRGAQNNAALQASAAGREGARLMSDANLQGSRLMSDANAQASFNAAAGQRAAQAAALQSNLATQGTQERAGFAAAAAEEAARHRAAQITSGEQQAALNLAANQANALRGSDIAGVGAATGIGNLALGQDTLITQAGQQDAGRMFDADTFNSTQAAQLGMFGQQMGLSYDQLNSGNLNALANRGMQGQQFGIGTQAGMAGQATQQQYGMALQQIMGNQQLAQLFVGLDEANKQRMLDEWLGTQKIATERRQQNMSLFGGGASGGGAGIMGAVMSDKRGKKSIKQEDAPDFKRAGSYSYEYKNPNASGAARGRHRGPMAQELPEDVLRRGDDGLFRVDIGRLALELASAVGDLQRKVAA